MMIKTKEAAINILIDQLETFADFRAMTTYRITEDFPKNGKRTYEVINLHAEAEDEFIMFNDPGNIIAEHDVNVLNMFSANSVRDIKLSWLKGSKECHMIIEFADGIIDIAAIID